MSDLPLVGIATRKLLTGYGRLWSQWPITISTRQHLLLGSLHQPEHRYPPACLPDCAPYPARDMAVLAKPCDLLPQMLGGKVRRKLFGNGWSEIECCRDLAITSIPMVILVRV